MKFRFIGFALLALFAISSGVKAETFTANLTQAQEVPASGSSATGYARVVVNPTTLAYTFTVVFTGLSSTQTASHIHAPGAIGVNAAVAINFGAVGGTAGTITGSGTMTATQLSQIRQHLGYVNVHSTNFSGGEIRGQLAISRPVDFDGDGRTDYSVLRFPGTTPNPITYWNLNSTAGPVYSQQWGDANTDFPTPGDYDGDGKDDYAIYRAGASTGAQSVFAFLRSSDNTAVFISFGLNGDQAVCRDFDGDGKTDLAVYRRGVNPNDQSFWWIRRSTIGLTVPGQDLVVPFGLTGDPTGGTSGDVPVPGDYDGDGKFDIAVYRFGFGAGADNTFFVLRSSDSAVQVQPWGNFNTDYITTGDYDGDGKTDFCAVRTGATGTSPMVWWILQSSTGTSRTQQYGISSDTPAQGDYDGDGRTDIAVYRAGATGAQSRFWVYQSFTSTTLVTSWGIGGDFATNTFDTR